MKRDRIRSQVARTVDGLPAHANGNVLPFTDRTRARRAPPLEWVGFRSFLAALPRLWVPRAERRTPSARRVETVRRRITHGDDAA